MKVDAIPPETDAIYTYAILSLKRILDMTSGPMQHMQADRRTTSFRFSFRYSDSIQCNSISATFPPHLQTTIRHLIFPVMWRLLLMRRRSHCTMTRRCYAHIRSKSRTRWLSRCCKHATNLSLTDSMQSRKNQL